MGFSDLGALVWKFAGLTAFLGGLAWLGFANADNQCNPVQHTTRLATGVAAEQVVVRVQHRYVSR